MSNIILPGQQVVRPDTLQNLKRQINFLKSKITEIENAHQARLLSINTQVTKVDEIMQRAFKKIDVYEKKLKELGYFPDHLLEEEDANRP